MPSILLINDNKIVSRLLQLSSEKNGYNLEEVQTLETSNNSYDVIFIDSDKYDDALLGEIESKFNYSKLGYIGVKQETVPDGFDIVIEKPFLPTDFVDIIKEQVIGKTAPIDNVQDEIEGFDIDDETELILEEDSLELENIDDDVEDLLTEEIALDEIEEGSDTLEDMDLSLDPSTVMTTGVAASMALEDSDPEELADIVSEIDQMKDEELNLDDSSTDDISDEDIKSLSQEDVEEELSALDDEKALDDIPSLEEMVEESIEDISTQEEESNDLTKVVAGVGMAAAGVVASKVLDSDETEELEELKEEVPNLDIDSLKESDIQSALGEEVTVEDIDEEIISEEIITEGEAGETMVEMDDMQAWIRDAVQKAITPEMIQEALNGMDITVNLTFNTKERNTPS